MKPRIHNLLLDEAGREVGDEEVGSNSVSRAAVTLKCSHNVDFDIGVVMKRGIADGWRRQRRRQ